MLSHRSAHYWLWFLLFGVVSVVASFVSKAGLTSESLWLLGTGLLGVILGTGVFSGRFSRGYDLLVGIFFTLIGFIGVLHNLGITLLTTNATLPSGTAESDTLFGLSLGLAYSLIHSVLGLTSLNLGMRSNVASPVVTTAARSVE